MSWKYRGKTLSKGGVVRDLFDYYTNTHPSSEEQFNDQKSLSGFEPTGWYKSWMEGRSLDEKNAVTRDMYGIDFDDIQYPWLSGITSGNTSANLGRGIYTLSSNVNGLYKSYGRWKKRKENERKQRFRRMYRHH